MNMKLSYRLMVIDKHGKVVKKTRWRKSKSYVFQWMQVIACQVTKADIPNVKDTGGANITVKTHEQNLRGQDCLVGDASKGIVVGSGTTAPANDDYQLETQIAHGVGAGQLQYQAGSYSVPAIVLGNVDFVITRTFLNQSGDTVTVTEIGYYFMAYDGSTTKYFCGIRDVLATAVDVPNGQTLLVQYTVRTTV